MAVDLKEATEGLKKIIHDHNASVDERFKQMADKGYVDGRLEERINKQQAELFAKIDAVKEANDLTNQRLQETLLFTDRKSENKDSQYAEEFVAQLHSEGGARELRDFGPKELARYRSAMVQYIRRAEAGLSQDMRADLQVGVQSDGGYWVTPDVDGRIVMKVFETSPIRQIASVQPISTDSLEGPAETSEMAAGWVGETATRADTDTAQIGKWTIYVHEMYAQPRTTQKLLDDARVDIAAWVERKIGEKFARTENAAFVSGDGNLKPRGILSQPAVTTGDDTRAWGSVQYVVTGVNGALPSSAAGDEYKKLTDFVVTLKAAYRANAAWVMNRVSLGAIMKVTDTQGRPLWQPDLRDNAFNIRLLGYNVVEAEDMPDSTVTDAYAVAFGDFREAYQIVDRVGVRILRDPYTAKGFVKFYATRRVGGDAINREAYKLLKFGTS